MTTVNLVSLSKGDIVNPSGQLLTLTKTQQKLNTNPKKTQHKPNKNPKKLQEKPKKNQTKTQQKPNNNPTKTTNIITHTNRLVFVPPMGSRMWAAPFSTADVRACIVKDLSFSVGK